MLRWLTTGLLLACAAPAVAQTTTGQDTSRAAARPGLTVAAPDGIARAIRFGLTMLPPIVPIDFGMPAVDSRLFTGVPFRDWVGEWSASAWRDLRARQDSLWRGPLTGEVENRMPLADRDVERTESVFRPVRPRADTTADILPGIVGQYADLGMRITGRGELGGSWTRYSPCDPSLHFNCNPGLFPQIRPDVQFGILAAGTISDRIHVNVDYDQAREQALSSNNINVYYQGFPDEILQRVEVGDVAFRLPQSRYLTQGIPAGNFGFTASGQLGPIDFQTVFAQQRGDLSTREFKLGGGNTQGFVQDEQIVLDDADYVKGQFFFVLRPNVIRNAPHIDILALVAGDAPADLRPAQGGTIQLYRDERLSPTSGQQGQLDVFLADAVSDDGTLKHSGHFRRLVPEQDYTVHSSGLWIMLRSPLRIDEALAVSYQTESGTIVGTLDPEAVPAGTKPQLRLLRSPVASHQPTSPTWPFEMHQVYRVNSSSGVDPSTVDLHVSLGDLAGGRTFKDSNGKQVTFLRLFGMDEDSPADLIDTPQIWQPTREDASTSGGASGGARITGTYVVFPTLEPFKTPPPVPSERLSAADALAVLGADRNPVIYDNPDPVARDGGARFRLNLSYRVKVDGLVQQFSLGQFGIREGSDRLQLGDRVLERGLDYTIDYEIGTVTLSDPQSLFGANPSAELRATWEQQSLFQIAPTSVFGTSATYRLGAIGELNFVGLYQAEKTLYSRPQLGTEPGAIFLGGTSAFLRFDGGWLDRALEHVPGLRVAGGSAVALDGEIAFSAPNPNRRNEAYVDDFEATDEVPIDVRRQQWRLGSRPGSNVGDDGVLPFTLDATTAARFVWQHDIAANGSITGSLLPQRDIDRQIVIAGTQLPEPVMWLTFGDTDDPAGEKRWRSFTTVLSTTGRDMTRSEFLEFYVSAGADRPLALVFDVGTVAEDAFYVDSLGNTNGTYASDGRPWGLDVLDEEARVAEREIWGPDKDARGLWDQPCLAEPLNAYPLGDPRSNCTRGNGVPDTEDLDGNGVLDVDDGAYFRYVVELDRMSPYLVRDTSATKTGFRLYRIPLRSGAGTPVNGASDGTWRFIKHLRVTVAGEPGGVRKNISLARIRIIGSRWTKRDIHGINRGLIGDEPGVGAGTTDLRVGPVSRLTDGSAYAPPPGVRDQLQDPSAQFGGGGIEFNEKSLRIRYEALEAGDRAEVYLRYPQAPKNFLTYRQMSLWAVARQGDWGTANGERLVVKVGTDPRNFYLYQTRLRTATGDRAATEADWLPELVVDFQQWFDLKAKAEERLIARGAGIGVDTLWSADSTYAIVLEDRARAPNLAAVRELSFAVYNGGLAPADGEVWLDDMRLGTAIRDPGLAGNVNLSLTGDFLRGNISYANRGALFRQLEGDASYLSTGDLSINTEARLDRFLPERWGVDMPLVVTHVSSAQDPLFLDRSDVLAERLDGLRQTGAGLTRIGLRVSKRTPSSNLWSSLLLDGSSFRIGYNTATNRTITARNDASGLDMAYDYARDVRRYDFDVLPGFLESLLRVLAPGPIERSDAFGRLVDARLRVTPARIGFGTSYYDNDSRAYRYDRILTGPGDTLIVPIASPRRGIENHAELSLQPFEPLSAGVTLRQSRDLLDPVLASTQPLERQALERARSSLAGADLGWETNRSMTSQIAFRPQLTSWLRPSWAFTNRFGTDRSPSYLEIIDLGSDSTATMQRRFGSDRQITRRLDIQPSGLMTAVLGTGADSASTVRRTLLRLGRALQPMTVSWNSGLTSQFEREPFAPGFGYQIGAGGLDGFRAIGSDTAATAVDRSDLRVSSGVALPLNALLTTSFLHTTNEGFDQRGGRRLQEQTGWPNLRLAWRQIPVPKTISGFVLSASAGAGYERIERLNILGSINPRRQVTDEDRFPVEMSVTFAKGITAGYTGTITTGTTTDPTGNAEHTARNHTVQLSGILQPPSFMAEKIKSPISTMLIFMQDTQRQCRFRPNATLDEGCVPYVDTSSRTVNLTMDTNLSDLTVGLRLSYTGRQNHVGTRTGTNQFQLGLFGQFNFSAGQFTGGGPR